MCGALPAHAAPMAASPALQLQLLSTASTPRCGVRPLRPLRSALAARSSKVATSLSPLLRRRAPLGAATQPRSASGAARVYTWDAAGACLHQVLRIDALARLANALGAPTTLAVAYFLARRRLTFAAAHARLNRRRRRAIREVRRARLSTAFTAARLAADIRRPRLSPSLHHPLRSLCSLVPLAPAPLRGSTPQSPQQREGPPVLTGGGRGVGKSVHSGKRAYIVGEAGSGWVSVRLLGRGAAGEIVKWRRSYLQRWLPDDDVADEPPTRKEVFVAAMQNLEPPSRRDPQTSSSPPPASAPSPLSLPPWLKVAADSRCVVVLFDLETKGFKGTSAWRISEMAVAAMVRVQSDGSGPHASQWMVPDGTLGRFSAKLGAAMSRADASLFIDWLTALSDAVRASIPDGASPPKLVLLAHNGHSCDWPDVTDALVALDMSLPPCVAALGCSRELFVAEKEEALGRKWSMEAIYKARFGKEIKNAHTAAGDVRCAQRLPCFPPSWASRARC